MTAERPTSKDSSTDQLSIDPKPDDLDPQARSLVVSGPIGFQGKGLPPNERKRIFDDLFFEDDRRGPYLKRFVVLIVLSALIAAFGEGTCCAQAHADGKPCDHPCCKDAAAKTVCEKCNPGAAAKLAKEDAA